MTKVKVTKGHFCGKLINFWTWMIKPYFSSCPSHSQASCISLNQYKQRWDMFMFTVFYFQDLASIRTSNESGDLTVLGHVKQRLVCTPDFNMLLNTATWQNLNDRIYVLIMPYNVLTVCDYVDLCNTAYTYDIQTGLQSVDRVAENLHTTGLVPEYLSQYW